MNNPLKSNILKSSSYKLKSIIHSSSMTGRFLTLPMITSHQSYHVLPQTATTITTTPFKPNNNLRSSMLRIGTTGIINQFYNDHIYPPSLHHHCTFSTRTRRRRRGGGNLRNHNLTSHSDDDSETSGLNGHKNDHELVKDPTRFLQCTKEYLDKIITALEPMKDINDIFTILRSQNNRGEENVTIQLKPSEGQYIFQVDRDMCTLSLTSPMSGNYVYVLCANTLRFVGMEDGHICEGMLVRDLIRHCHGVPKL